MARQCTETTLDILIRNNTASANLFVHVTGRAIDSDYAPIFIKSDGKTPYLPESPSKILSPLREDCAIPIGGPGNSRTITVPRIAGGRIWFCRDVPLQFMLNPGPAVVEPSVMNPSDANYYLDWGFAEFTFNDFQLFVNISYVDFVSIPVSLTLENTAGQKSFVEGLPPGGLDVICSRLQEQDGRDGAGWGRLVVRTPDMRTNLRALSPNSGNVIWPGLFEAYYRPYVEAVWNKYRSADLRVNTQAEWGTVVGRVMEDSKLSFGGIGDFGPPSAADIFSCSTGPFARTPDYTEGKGAVGARLAAAFNRSTLLLNNEQPEGEKASTYYRDPITNHYSRICHEVSLGGRGYAFPYDDVGPSDGTDQSGSLWDGSPKLLTIGIGGGI